MTVKELISRLSQLPCDAPIHLLILRDMDLSEVTWDTVPDEVEIAKVEMSGDEKTALIISEHVDERADDDGDDDDEE